MLICGGIGRGDVDGACESRRVEKKEDGGQGIGKGDPTYVLTSAAEPATQAEAEDGEHARERSALCAEYDTKAEMKDTDACVDGGPGCSFPMLTARGEKTGAEGRGFVEEVIAAIAVYADGRSDQERAGGMAKAGEGSGKGAGSVDAALGDFVLVVKGPSVCRKVRAGEMDGGRKVFKALRVTNLGGGGGVPLELIGLFRS